MSLAAGIQLNISIGTMVVLLDFHHNQDRSPCHYYYLHLLG